jgi:hypothetical protein
MGNFKRKDEYRHNQDLVMEKVKGHTREREDCSSNHVFENFADSQHITIQQTNKHHITKILLD